MSNNRLEGLLSILEQEPNDSFTHYAVALEYASMNEVEKAISKLRELILLDPKYVPAYQQLGAILSQSDRQTEALDTYEQGIKIATATGEPHAAKEMQEAIDEIRDQE
jgi:DNA-binding SARP family transcriptional activator